MVQLALKDFNEVIVSTRIKTVVIIILNCSDVAVSTILSWSVAGKNPTKTHFVNVGSERERRFIS